MAKHRSVHSTTRHLINTVGNVREIVNTLYHHNPATTPLTDIQIGWLLRSPLESVIKNIIFFHMVYYTALREIRREYIVQLLEKIGLKKQAARYYEWLEEQESAHWSFRSHDEIYHPELLHPPKPKPHMSPVEEMFEELHRLEAHYVVAVNDLTVLQHEHNVIIQALLTHHHHHVNTVCIHALEYGIKLTPEMVMTRLPRAIEASKSAQSVNQLTERLRALAMFTNEGEMVNNIVRLQQFLGSATLQTTMLRYHTRLEQLNNEFSNKSAQVVECKMRCAHLESRIQHLETSIAKIQQPTPKPEVKTTAPELTYNPTPEAITPIPEPSVQRPEYAPEPPAKSAYSAEIEFAKKASQKSLASLFRAGLRDVLEEEALEALQTSAPAA